MSTKKKCMLGNRPKNQGARKTTPLLKDSRRNSGMEKKKTSLPEQCGLLRSALGTVIRMPKRFHEPRSRVKGLDCFGGTGVVLLAPLHQMRSPPDGLDRIGFIALLPFQPNERRAAVPFEMLGKGYVGKFGHCVVVEIVGPMKPGTGFTD